MRHLTERVKTIALRDQFITELVHDQSLLNELAVACRSTSEDDPYAPDLNVVTSIAAFIAGDEWLGHACLDRAQRLRPDHALAGLVRTVWDIGIAPHAFGRVLLGDLYQADGGSLP